MISRMLSASRRVAVLDDVDVGVERLDREPRRLRLRHPDPLGVVDHLALQVGGVDDVVVDEAERADAGGGEVERGRARRARRRRAAGPWRSASSAGRRRRPRAAACGASSGRAARRVMPLGGDDRQPLLLPGEDAAGHRGDVLVAEPLQLLGGDRGAVAGAAVEDRARRLVGGGRGDLVAEQAAAAPACRSRGGPPGTRAARGCRSGRRRRPRSPAAASKGSISSIGAGSPLPVAIRQNLLNPDQIYFKEEAVSAAVRPQTLGRICRSRLTRSSIGGWVEKRPAMPLPEKGLTM